MNKGLAGCLIVGGGLLLILVIGGMVLMGTYNTLVAQNEQVNQAWAQVQNVLQRRADLIPNLVETVKGYATHEKEVFENVAEARSRLAGATSPREAAAANAGLTSALGRLAGTENRIAVERMRYNEAVRAFNTSIKRFPTNFLAGLFKFGEREYFEAEASAQEAPKVKF